MSTDIPLTPFVHIRLLPLFLMRIIHLSYNYVPEYTDPEAWLKRISFSTGVLESMARYAEVLGIYNINYDGVLHKKDVTYHFAKYNRWELLFPIQFNQYIKNLRPDVVIVHGLIFPWQVIMLQWQVGRKLKIIAQHHAEKPLRDVRQYIQRWADRYILAYLFCSFDLGQPWVERGQIRAEKKIKEIMGTSSPFFAMEKEVAKAKTNVVGDPVFLWVGGLDTNKDPLLVVHAFIRFLKINPSAKLYMIYQTFQLLNELQYVIDSTPGASESIFLVGKVDNDQLLYWYNSGDFIISSSHYEGSGIAVCEGLSCGCIPILTDIPSFRMMTGQGRIGLLYKVGDQEALLTAFIASQGINRLAEKRVVLEQFEKKLSFDANAKSIMEVVNAL